jgi:hypothetical protein
MGVGKKEGFQISPFSPLKKVNGERIRYIIEN